MEIGRPRGQQAVFAGQPGEGQDLAAVVGATGDLDGVAAQVAATLAEAGWADTGYRLLDASRGGFARLDGRLARFIVEFETASGVALEPLYTGKLLLRMPAADGQPG